MGVAHLCNKIIMGAELSVVGLSEISTKYSTLSTQALGELREQQPEDKELEDEIRRRILIKEEEIRRKYAGISTVTEGGAIDGGEAVSKVPVAEIDSMVPADVVKTLKEALQAKPLDHTTVETCCMRVRVLCRETAQLNECQKLGASAAVVEAMKVLPFHVNVQLQGLAAIVNLYSRDENEHRNMSVSSGALVAVVNAMIRMGRNAEVQEMGCIALQNCCYGEDEAAIHRRQSAANAGALKAVADAMHAHHAIPAAQELGENTLRHLLHNVPELREYAIICGAKPKWLEPFVKESHLKLKTLDPDGRRLEESDSPGGGMSFRVRRLSGDALAVMASLGTSRSLFKRRISREKLQDL